MTRHTGGKSKTGAGLKGPEGAFKNLVVQFEKVLGEAVKQTSGTMSKKSHFRYRDSMKGFLWFCADRFRLKKVANVGERHVRAYVEHRRGAGISEKTLKEDLSAIRFFHRFSEARNKLPDNYELGIEKTPAGGTDRAWTHKEFEDMIAEAKRLGREDVVLTMRIARLAGLRIHECTRLTIGQVQDGVERGEFEIVGKGGRARVIPVGEALKTVLDEVLESRAGASADKVFVSEGGKAHSAIKSIQKFIYRHRGKVTDRDITAHGLRHAYAGDEFIRGLGEAREDGSHSKRRVREAKLRVAELLGHGRPEVTDIYVGRSKGGGGSATG